MRRGIVVALLGLLAASVARCASFGEGDRDDANDAGFPDVTGVDAGGADVAPSADGGALARDGGPSPRFCDDAASEFCDDFDQPGRQDVTQGWDQTDAGSLLALTENGGSSPPRALLLVTPPINSTTDIRSSLTHLVPDSGLVPQSVTVAFDLKVTEQGFSTSGGIFVPFRLRFEEAGTSAGFLIRGLQTGFYESFANGSASYDFNGPVLIAGTWQRVRFAFDRDTRTVRIAVSASSASSSSLQVATTVSGQIRVELGAARLKGDFSQWAVSFDNVTVDVVR